MEDVRNDMEVDDSLFQDPEEDEEDLGYIPADPDSALTNWWITPVLERSDCHSFSGYAEKVVIFLFFQEKIIFRKIFLW